MGLLLVIEGPMPAAVARRRDKRGNRGVLYHRERLQATVSPEVKNWRAESALIRDNDSQAKRSYFRISGFAEVRPSNFARMSRK